MTLPELVRERLGGESPVDRVPIGGDDELIVTPTRTLIYRSEGLLSSEAVEEHSLNAERLAVSEGRRQTTVRLEHGLEGNSQFKVPSKHSNDVLVPILSGVLSTAGVTGEDEPIRALYRLGELSVLVTDERVIKHIGNAVWDEEFEEFAFDDVTGLDIERGDVSSQVIIEVDGRPERIKTPSDDARRVREQIERRLLAHHGVESYEEFRRKVAPDEDDAEREAEPLAEIEFDDDDDVDDLSAEGLVFDVDADDAGAPTAEAGVSTDGDLADELSSLREAVERQNDVLESHQETIEQLIEELRRGR